MHQLSEKILARLPYSEPFRFVSGIVSINENQIKGFHRFRTGDFFYQGHFTDDPVTPGVILLETMGQIGLVTFGIYLFGLHENELKFRPWLSWLESDFFKAVGPGEQVYVTADKIYLRRNQLKCRIEMTDVEGKTIVATKATCTFEISQP
ncbi:MAG: hydroxymyristoyl-ACP dehydratase [Bacteroidetes bacterium]|nr:hydroxymyristoyl-ACP dehydratase [Bacteroidota bacterium]MBU1719579.1 hydroxymyristoyl-ACP dehydratase [Bacteroidota bacterium]